MSSPFNQARLVWWLGLAMLAVLVYLVVALTATPLGFPLDDAWIHQVFARNLARHGEFSYNPGEPVAGSTSPLWTFLLAPGYLLDSFYIPWTYGLGIIFLALTAREVYKLTEWLGGSPRTAWATGLLTIFEWRLTWAGASGMETGVFIFGTLWLSRFYLSRFPNRKNLDQNLKNPLSQSKFVVGLVGGLLTLVRPEGMVLLGLIGLDWAWRERRQFRALLTGASLLLLGFLVPVLPYFAFNYWLSHSLLPNTFGAKVSAYGNLSILTFLAEALREIWLAGAMFALLPGLFFALIISRAGKLDGRALIWPPVLFMLYAVRLPVTYHHARYLLPVLPFLIIYGGLGTGGLIDWLRRQRLPIVARFLPGLIGLLWLVAWLINTQAYQFDVKFINDEQVRVGRWLARNTPPDAIIATHDIGAIEYFSERHLIDTAGLVSPDFVRIVADQPAILARLKELKVDYFAMLPVWYQDLYEQFQANRQAVVFEPQETYLERFGQKNMVVYKLR